MTEDNVSTIQCKSYEMQGNARVVFRNSESLISDSDCSTCLCFTSGD